MGRSGRVLKQSASAKDLLFKEIANLLPKKATLYLVGGSVRDQLMNKESKDYDFAVSGLEPEELLKINRVRVEPLKIADQTVGVRLFSHFTPKEGVELALTRTETSSGPGHRDWNISVGKTIDEDLLRRDFTCNAIAEEIDLNGRVKLIDPLGGVDDIKNNLLRETHPLALKEDPLRILRGLARIATDNFDLEETTADSFKKYSELIAENSPLSQERILKETRKIINGEFGFKALSLARDLGIYEKLFFEMKDTVGFEQKSRYHDLTVDEHCLRAYKAAKENNFEEAVLFAALFHDSGKPEAAWLGDDNRLHYYQNARLNKRDHAEIGQGIADKITARMKFPRDLSDDISFLVKNHMFGDDRDFIKRPAEKKALIARRFLAKHGKRKANLLVDLRIADNSGKMGGAGPRIDDTNEFRNELKKAEGYPTKVSDLEINGNDLKKLGLKGEAIGKALNEFLKRVLVDPNLNTKERLLSWAEKIRK
jgi:tRNA nucleotidyltransferase (CCA-adding enzyme)